MRTIIDTPDCLGNPPLSNASCKGYTEVLKLLVELGANPMVIDSDGGTPMDIAKRDCNHERISILEVSLKALNTSD